MKLIRENLEIDSVLKELKLFFGLLKNNFKELTN